MQMIPPILNLGVFIQIKYFLGHIEIFCISLFQICRPIGLLVIDRF